MDRSFQGLLISIVLHVLLVVFLVNAKFPHAPVKEAPTEITLVEPKQKAKAFTLGPKKPVNQPVTHDDDAKFQSNVTRRVKENTVARTDPNKQGRDEVTRVRPNFAPQFNPRPPRPQQPTEHVGGIGTRPQPQQREYQPVQSQAIGASGMAEYIPGVKEGSITTYSSDQFTYYAFFSRLNDAIRYPWVSRVRGIIAHSSQQQLQELATHPRVTMIQVLLTPDGQIKSVFVESSSGSKEVDQAGVDAFTNAAPFLNPPRGMIESDGLIHLPARFEVWFGPPGFGLNWPLPTDLIRT